MNGPLAQLEAATPLTTRLFPPSSRYHGIETAEFKTKDGKTVVYLRRRFVPSPDRFTLLLEHSVKECDRLDNIAAHYLGDPEAFWRICDSNGAMLPEELEEIGRKVRITLPEGIPGQQND